MEKQVLFTVTDIKGTSVPIYGPTNQKLESSKPVASTHKYSSDVIRERISLLKAHEKYQNKNKYFQQGKMDIWEQEKKDIMTLSNWKLRVLEEQKKNELKDTEDAEMLLKFALSARREAARKAKEEKKVTKPASPKNTLVRRSARLAKDRFGRGSKMVQTVI
tara:strand:+ start:1979 stop:2464 length:486 start_codon:yes stop_codon:yes gene_type:complete